ncbi:putative fasciclin-like arabinogalactan protein 20 [Momordica charantia]|uniref:Fasciclin-like arabinogalactan protein 20 n=1 Tax=Momordica charantia TaxID=3673 RepID=A0A6J1DAK1_MOMCH|nr:putative fasciclin-like arabinogalactan protein 20 [Momordica charantia]
MASAVSISLILLSLFSLSSPLPSQTVLDAAEILSDNGFVSMALTLELIAESLLSHSNSLTIFSPSDAAFAQSGQPSLSLLQFHFLPLYLSPESLKSLASGTKIPTMLPGRSLTVTSSSRSDSEISLNRVKINSSPFYDDGSLIVFGVEKFFDLKLQVPPLTQSPGGAEFRCGPSTEENPFGEAIKTLKSNGYSSMALFLESQIPGFNNGQSMMTVFAPSDEALATRVDNFTEYPSLYFRQILPCRILWNDLVNIEDGTELATYSEGYTISIVKSSGMLTINGVEIFYPNMYVNEWLAVHGLL